MKSDNAMNDRVRLLKRPTTIRSRLILLVLSVLLPALLMGFWVMSLSLRIARDTNQSALEDSARALSMVLSLELAQRAGVVRGLALSRMLDPAPSISARTLRDFDAQARQALTGLEGWLEVHTADRLLIDTRLPQGQLPQGISADPMELVDTPQIQPLKRNPINGIMHATLVHPVLRDGRAVLNLRLSILPNELQRLIDQQTIEQDWVATILDSEGRVVARHPGGARYAGRMATQDLQERLAQAREGLLHSKSLDGHATSLYFSTTAQGWTYATGMPLKNYRGGLPPEAQAMAVTTLGLFSLALIAAMGVSRSIARPIQTIKHLASEMQQGKSVQPLETGISECNQVSEALGRASQTIANAQTEMERRVQQAIALTQHAEQRMSSSHRLEALGRLTGGVAHDFNNLLGVISNSGHLLLRKTSDPNVTAAVETTLRAVETGTRLTQHLLRFSGRQPVKPCAIYPAVFMADTAELLRAVMGHRITLKVVVAPDAPVLFADPNELELALINLALNARDAIPEKGQVELRAGRAESSAVTGLDLQDYGVISVTDDGVGISDAVIKRVFEPFFTTKNAEQASGLGLSQVYGFCTQSGGDVRIDSTPGLGTTVSMLLPAHRPETQAPEPSKPTDAPTLQGKRVLLVEDNKDLSMVTNALIMTFGCEVICADSAENAWRLLNSQSGIDAMVSDVLMPGPMNGIELVKKVRARFPRLAVVLISGHPGDTTDLPDVPFVSKPYQPQSLIELILKAMSSSGAS